MSQDMALLAAINKKDTKAAKAALEAGASPDAVDEYGRPALHQAIRRKSKTLVRALLKAGAALDTVDDKGQIPFTLLVQHIRDTKLAAEMVAQNADINAPDQDRHGGLSPIHYAVKYVKLDWWAPAPAWSSSARSSAAGASPPSASTARRRCTAR